MARKLALRLNEHNNGYMAMGRYAVWTSDVNTNDKPDLNEAFFIKRERAPDDPLRRSGRRFVGANVQPDGRNCRNSVAACWTMPMPWMRSPGACCRRLPWRWTCRRLVRRSLPAEPVFVRLSHYPPVAASANQFGIAPHTDSNFMTFLAQTDVPGLQVRMPSGDWLEVPYIPGSFAVNSGDMMRRWTNGRFKSTPHRALPPVGGIATPFRSSSGRNSIG